MALALCTLGFLLWAPTSQGCIQSVTQGPPVSVALTGEVASITCTITVSPVPDAKSVSVCVLRENTPVTCQQVTPTAPADNIIKKRLMFQVDGRTNKYLCNASCDSTWVTGEGTYIHVRDSGYADPSTDSSSLLCGLIVLLVLLLLLSGAGTLLLLHPFIWKKQGGLRVFKAAGKPPKAQGDPGGQENTGSLYASLQPQLDDVYHVLDDETPPSRAQDKKHQVQIHENQSPARRPKPAIKPTSYPEKIQQRPGKPPQKQAAHTADDLYENLSLGQ
ncbi:NFAT activation molecule 1 [Spea bombifrons]|uniref:NFAT activation molecule 1 n=1 Tax=Spea bombifrons TaxID=233779 RepID=UPI002349F9A8|nr:NFAT activation molecule 1 [Spea bombifrons]